MHKSPAGQRRGLFWSETEKKVHQRIIAEVTARVSPREMKKLQVQVFCERYCTRISLFVGADEQPGGGQGGEIEKCKPGNHLSETERASGMKRLVKESETEQKVILVGLVSIICKKYY